MKLSRIVAALLASAAIGAHADTVFSQGFEDVSSLTTQGWDIWNQSQKPYGDGWFQGSEFPFPAAAGSVSSYAAANYLGTVYGSLDDWLVTPAIQLTGNDSLDFMVRSVDEPGWTDSLRVLIAGGSADSARQFHTTLFDMAAAPGEWTDIHIELPSSLTSVRIAFEYYGSFTTSNYLGLDSVSVTSAVPEPTSALLLGLGLGGIALVRRRRVAAECAEFTGASSSNG